jgi:hypothetical protein
MIGIGASRQRTRPRNVVLLAVGLGGLATGITLVFLGMRSVLDVGGACASGGPYVPAQPCPEGAVPALFLGVIGGLGFGALALASAGRIGGAWPGVVIIAGWSGLFASLGWNFLDYGLVNPPEGGTVIWGWLIPGLVFEAMAIAPVLIALLGARAASVRRRMGVSGLDTGSPEAVDVAPWLGVVALPSAAVGILVAVGLFGAIAGT